MNLLKRLSLLIAFCAVFTIGTKLVNSQVSEGKAWVAITYAAAENGSSNEEVAGIGAFGVLHSAMEGAIWGTVIGGPAGTIAGIVWGL